MDCEEKVDFYCEGIVGLECSLKLFHFCYSPPLHPLAPFQKHFTVVTIQRNSEKREKCGAARTT